MEWAPLAVSVSLPELDWVTLTGSAPVGSVGEASGIGGGGLR